MNPALVAAATQAGAFSIVGGVWIDERRAYQGFERQSELGDGAREAEPLGGSGPYGWLGGCGQEDGLLAAIGRGLW